MIQNFWNYFETTGDINMYLGLKEYEQTYKNVLHLEDEDSYHAK